MKPCPFIGLPRRDKLFMLGHKFNIYYIIFRDGNFEEIAKAGSFHEFLVGLHKRFGPIASFWWKKHQVVSIASAELFAETEHMFDRPRM